jgi:hypothetical protein
VLCDPYFIKANRYVWYFIGKVWFKKLGQRWHCHCYFSMNFLANSYFVFQISHAKTFETRYTRYLYISFIWKYSWKCLKIVEDDAQNSQFRNGRFTTINWQKMTRNYNSWSFFVNYTNIFHKMLENSRGWCSKFSIQKWSFYHN